jgi:hypothetical protein
MNLRFTIYDLRLPDEDAPRLMGAIEASRFNIHQAMRCYTPGGSDTPYIPEVGSQYTQLLNAMISGMPAVQSAAATYDPQSTAQSLTDLSGELSGVNGAPGYLDIYQNKVAPVLNATTATANTAARTANLGDLASLGPGAADAVAGIDPATAALSKSLTSTATGQLAQGTAIDPFTMDNTINSVLGAYSNRGLGTSPTAQLGLSTGLAAGGQALLGQRESTASGVVNQNMQNYTDPILAMLGINSPTAGQAQNLTTTGSGLATGATSPTSITTNDLTSLLGTTYNASAASNISNANNASAICGSAIGAGGSIGSSLIKGPTGGY